MHEQLPSVASSARVPRASPPLRLSHERGIPFDCFEKSDRVGGNWVFGNKNGMSSAYRSLHINTSRERMEFTDFPMPTSYPDFPHHSQIAAYFDAYVDHFGFRDRIRFETGVEHAEREADGSWTVALDDGRDAPLRRAARRQRPPLGPALARAAVPGQLRRARRRTRTTTVDNEPFEGKRVLVVGMGNSAMDIAVESSLVADATFLSARRGAHIIPKYLFGRPLDQIGVTLTGALPWAFRKAIFDALLPRSASATWRTTACRTGPPPRRRAPDDLRPLPQPPRARRDQPSRTSPS